MQAGKRQKKFMAFPESMAWIAIVDASRYLYLYQYVAPGRLCMGWHP